MKILSNFDTKATTRLMDACCAKYGEENVIFVRRDYIFFVFRVIIPTVLWAIMLIALLVLMYVTVSGTDPSVYIARWLGRAFIIVTGIYFLYYLVTTVLDYYLDFTIITPKQITSYNQSGFFSKSTRSLDINKIKSIRVDQFGILSEHTKLWFYRLLSEGDRQDLGDITLKFITNPNDLKDRIGQLLEKHEKIQEEDE